MITINLPPCLDHHREEAALIGELVLNTVS
jgi:hypothetical protein